MKPPRVPEIHAGSQSAGASAPQCFTSPQPSRLPGFTSSSAWVHSLATFLPRSLSGATFSGFGRLLRWQRGIPRTCTTTVSLSDSLSSGRASSASAQVLPFHFSSAGSVSRFIHHTPPITMTATPNHALQRTAPRVTVAAISSPGVSRPSHLCPTSVAPFCAPPSQLPRHAPPSLSLGSLGVC